MFPATADGITFSRATKTSKLRFILSQFILQCVIIPTLLWAKGNSRPRLRFRVWPIWEWRGLLRTLLMWLNTLLQGYTLDPMIGFLFVPVQKYRERLQITDRCNGQEVDEKKAKNEIVKVVLPRGARTRAWSRRWWWWKVWSNVCWEQIYRSEQRPLCCRTGSFWKLDFFLFFADGRRCYIS